MLVFVLMKFVNLTLNSLDVDLFCSFAEPSIVYYLYIDSLETNVTLVDSCQSL